jgi:hypothetical protein
MKTGFGVLFTMASLMPSAALAYDSGSTGADGALSLAAGESRVVQVPASGILNYTTVTLAGGATLQFKANADNTPVTVLATGDVSIAGGAIIDVSGGQPTAVTGYADVAATGGLPGPGGSYGATKYIDFLQGDDAWSVGHGPGGGAPSIDSGCPTAGGGGSPVTAGDSKCVSGWGKPFADITWKLLSAGSGGGTSTGDKAMAGAGGGGGITIASSGKVTVLGSILARGGDRPAGTTYGGGGGGFIRIAATQVAGTGILDARAGCSGGRSVSGEGGCGGDGIVRIEATDYTKTLQSYPVARLGLPGRGLPYPQDKRPSLRIVSVGGRPVVPAPGWTHPSLAPVLVLPQDQVMQAELEGHFIPPGSLVQVRINNYIWTGTLEGTLESTTCSITISVNNEHPAGSVEAWVVKVPLAN